MSVMNVTSLDEAVDMSKTGQPRADKHVMSPSVVMDAYA